MRWASVTDVYRSPDVFVLLKPEPACLGMENIRTIINEPTTNSRLTALS
jgi:hypothetical protein